VTVYFMGGEMPSFIPSSSQVTEATSAGGYDPAFSRCYMRTGGTTGHYMTTPALTLPDAFYTHLYVRRDSSSSLTTNMLRYYASGIEVFRVETTTSAIQMKALISAVMTNVGTATTWAGSQAEYLDLYINGNDATGDAILFLGGSALKTVSGIDLTAVTGIDEVRLDFGYNVSQMAIDDQPTIGRRMFTQYPNGAGNASAWTGAFGDVDETINDDADFVNSSTNGQVEQFAQTGPAVTGYVPVAVGVYARAKRGASGPANLYFSTDKLLTVGYSAYGEIWEDNPSTMTGFLGSQISALQPSLKAVT
jgi:hypothetical protein